ncbi:MAG: ribonuclease HIII [Candidatus Gastranaerophilales bacterium]|nr:ribonuclease HIII [Candidatus Gastranaerophilales bacterium]
MSTFSEKISPINAEKVKQLLQMKEASFDAIQYSVWRAKTPLWQVTYYESGKILVQGKESDGIINEISAIMGKASLAENETAELDFPVYIGTDESGKGDFFGPLVVAGVQVNEKNKSLFKELGVKDSKKLDDIKIRKLAAHIRNNSVHSVVVMSPKKYNELYSKFKNLNKLLAWGHARAIENILEKSPCEYALSDKFGDESLILNALMKNGQKIKLEQRVRGESNIAVAAASIIARAEYVKRMDELSGKYSINLPKGASSKVLEQGKLFVSKNGKDSLNEVAKMHFKTATQVLS